MVGSAYPRKEPSSLLPHHQICEEGAPGPHRPLLPSRHPARASQPITKSNLCNMYLMMADFGIIERRDLLAYQIRWTSPSAFLAAGSLCKFRFSNRCAHYLPADYPRDTGNLCGVRRSHHGHPCLTSDCCRASSSPSHSISGMWCPSASRSSKASF